MPNTDEHAVYSAIAGLFTYAIVKKQMTGEQISTDEAIGVLLVSGGVGTAPDLLEPPTSPRHRGIFHSFSSLGPLAYVSDRVMKNEVYTPRQKALFAALAAAYATHLLADSTTPAGLPTV